jgi:hypothetical protein
MQTLNNILRRSSARGPCIGKSTKSLKIFFSGGLGGPWMSGWQRCECVKNLGHEVIELDQDNYISRALCRNPFMRLQGLFYHEQVVEEFNRDVLARLVVTQPDIAWFEWPLLLRKETLDEAASLLPNCALVSFQDDNPFGSRSEELRRWQYFLKAAPAYHLHLVKRSSDIRELKTREARQVQLFRHGYLGSLFRPLPNASIPPAFHQDVSFVGTPLDHRTAAISELLIRKKIPLRVYGGRWKRTLVYHRRKACFRPPVLGDDYVRVICGSRISLGFVSSSNQDEYTMRTFEIPACRGFLLAERTPIHQELFTEGTEAEFFSSTEECADKIKFYLLRESLRSRIADNGYQRCIKSDYSLLRSIANAVDQLQLLRK